LSKLAYPDFILNKALSRAKSSFFHPRPKQAFQMQGKMFVPFVTNLNSTFNQRYIKSSNSDLIFNYPNSLKSNLVNNSSKSVTQSGVYRIPCKGCNTFYIEETGRDLSVRLKEHKKAIASFNPLNALATHSSDLGHCFDFNNSSIIYKSNDVKTRRIVESAFINKFSSDIINNNSGFYPLNSNVSNFILKSIK